VELEHLLQKATKIHKLDLTTLNALYTILTKKWIRVILWLLKR